MGLLCHYFSAGSDEDASGVIDGALGPGPDGDVGWDVVAADGIEPVVMMRELEALLRRMPYEEVAKDDRSGRVLALRDGGERLVVSVSDALRDALTDANTADLAAVAIPWSQIEEFWGQGDPDLLESVLVNLKGQAERARERHRHVYCWVCV